jgi:hypothetical protein
MTNLHDMIDNGLVTKTIISTQPKRSTAKGTRHALSNTPRTTQRDEYVLTEKGVTVLHAFDYIIHSIQWLNCKYQEQISRHE